MTEVHIASFIVYTKPFALSFIAANLQSLPGVEIHERDASGKLVIVYESDRGLSVNELLDRVHALQGVVHVTLVSHFVESPETLEEVLTP
jgi:nitrate reductase NapD